MSEYRCPYCNEFIETECYKHIVGTDTIECENCGKLITCTQSTEYCFAKKETKQNRELKIENEILKNSILKLNAELENPSTTLSSSSSSSTNIRERIENHKVYCTNCGFGTGLTEDEYNGLNSHYLGGKKCPVCNQQLENKSND